jgi:zinc protease
MVGDFDPKEAQTLIKDLFGDWKSPVPFKRVATQHFDVPAADQVLEAPDKANAFFYTRLNIKIRNDNPDYAALLLGDFMFGGGFLNSRFATRVRQKDGVSYGAGSGLTAGSIDEVGQFTAYAIYAPENMEKVEKGFREELDRVLKEGYTEAEVKDAISAMLQYRKQQRAQDNSLAGTLRNHLFVGRTMAYEEELDKRIASLTAADVNAAMKKYITPDKISVFKAGDFAKAKEKMKAKAQ